MSGQMQQMLSTAFTAPTLNSKYLGKNALQAYKDLTGDETLENEVQDNMNEDGDILDQDDETGHKEEEEGMDPAEDDDFFDNMTDEEWEKYMQAELAKDHGDLEHDGTVEEHAQQGAEEHATEFQQLPEGAEEQQLPDHPEDDVQAQLPEGATEFEQLPEGAEDDVQAQLPEGAEDANPIVPENASFDSLPKETQKMLIEKEYDEERLSLGEMEVLRKKSFDGEDLEAGSQWAANLAELKKRCFGGMEGNVYK